MTNQARNTATVTNQGFGSAGIAWNAATFTWDEAAGTWNNPYTFVNQVKNSASVTNQSL